jgi:phosphatidylglycerophosphate synthase
VRRYPTGDPLSRGRTALRTARRTVLAGGAVAATVGGGMGMRYSGSVGTTVAATVGGSLPAVLTALAVVRRDPPFVTTADRVTLARSVLGGGCAAATVLALAGSAPDRTWELVALAVPTLALDAVDGAVARRTGCATSEGALLDMQVDAGVLLVLSLAAAPVLGPWVLLLGLMRYLFVAASWVWPLLRTPLPRSQFRRVVAGVQGAVLVAALAPVVPVDAARAAVLVALLLLAGSFGTQIAAIRRAVSRETDVSG